MYPYILLSMKRLYSPSVCDIFKKQSRAYITCSGILRLGSPMNHSTLQLCNTLMGARSGARSWNISFDDFWMVRVLKK